MQHFITQKQLKLVTIQELMIFCVLSGKIKIGKNVHIATHNILAGGESGLKIGDYVGIAAKCHIFCKSDDYKGGYFNGPTVNKKYTNQLDKSINVKKHVLIGTNVLVLPGTLIGEEAVCI